MKYKKIHINQSGLKGAAVEYFEPNDRQIMELTKKFPRNPVHLGLQKLFKDLRVHLLNICGVINPDMDNNVAAQHLIETTVDCVEMDGDTITLTGDKLATADKYIKLKTYKLEAEDGYEHYDEVFNLVNAICDETTEYMKGSKKVSDAEIILQWADMKHKNEEFTMEKLLSLPPEQLQEMATRIIEKGLGGVVLMPQDMTIDEANMNEVVEELKTEFEITEDAIEIEVGVVKESKPKKTKKVEAHSPVKEEEQF